MKIFDRDGKINFVDKNNVFVGYDMCSQCCENFGYFFSTSLPSVNQMSGDITDESILEDYNFNTTFYHELSQDEDSTITFQLKNDTGNAIYLTLFNHHNGYYAHGFDMKINGIVVRSGSL